MASLKFRFTFEDYDDISRDIEIKPSQTFLDLHNCFQASINFDNSKPASFFMSNDKWLKGTEIASAPRKLKDGTDVLLMENAVMSKYIYDPHQKIYYEFGEWSFYVELIKINTGDDKNTLPRCVRVNGEAPRQYKVVKIIPDVVDIPGILLPEEDLEPDLDEIDEVETSSLEQEEGLDDGETPEGFEIDAESEVESEDEADQSFGREHDEL